MVLVHVHVLPSCSFYFDVFLVYFCIINFPMLYMYKVMHFVIWLYSNDMYCYSHHPPQIMDRMFSPLRYVL